MAMAVQLDKKSLRGLKSPDQLDRAIRLSSPANWLAILFLLLIVVAVIVWAIFGALPTRVTGLGMILPSGGKVFNVPAPANGLVSDVFVKVGDVVKAGDPIAVLTRGIELDAIKAEEEKLKALASQFKQSSSRVQALLKDRRQTHSQLVASLRRKIATYRTRMDFLQNSLKQQQADLKAGYITRKEYRETQDDIDDLRFQISDTEQQIADEAVQLVEFLNQQRQSLNSQELQITDAQIRVEQLKADQQVNERITSPVDATVVEVAVKVGDIAAASATVVELLTGGRTLVVHSFFRAADGKKIAPGMGVRISISSAEAAIYGTAIGVVDTVADLPATSNFIQDLLGNDAVTEQMLQDGAPIYSKIKFVLDAETPSGIAWSSSKGPPFKVFPGTFANVVVTVASEPPINYVVPILPMKRGNVTANNG